MNHLEESKQAPDNKVDIENDEHMNMRKAYQQMDLMTSVLRRTRKPGPDNLKYAMFFIWAQMIRMLFKMRTYNMCMSTFNTFERTLSQIAEGFSMKHLPIGL